MRDAINSMLKSAMREKNTLAVSTLRLVNAAIKDQDIAARAEGNHEGIADAQIMALLQKMIRQRQESADIYAKAGRNELAEKERSEINIIQGFLPEPLSSGELETLVEEVVAELGAGSIRDMGKVMTVLREKTAGRAEGAALSALVKQRLS